MYRATFALPIVQQLATPHMSTVEKLQHWQFRLAFGTVDETPEAGAKLATMNDSIYVSKIADGTPVKIYWYHDLESFFLYNHPLLAHHSKLHELRPTLEKTGSREWKTEQDSVALDYPRVDLTVSVGKDSVRIRYSRPARCTSLCTLRLTTLALI